MKDWLPLPHGELDFPHAHGKEGLTIYQHKQSERSKREIRKGKLLQISNSYIFSKIQALFTSFYLSPIPNLSNSLAIEVNQ